MNYYYITGTSRGIGKAIAEELLKEPSNVVIGISRSPAVYDGNYRHHQLDLSTVEAVSNFEFEDHRDAASITLINNAAALREVKHLGNLQNETIVADFNVNVVAVAILMNNFIKKYQVQKSRKLIINLTSGAAQSAYDGWSVYCASKAAIDMLTKVAHEEQVLKGDDAIRVLSIAPGVVDTQMQTMIRNVNPTGFSRKQKFIDLFENDQLYHAADVAKAFAAIIKNPEKLEGVIHRISL